MNRVSSHNTGRPTKRGFRLDKANGKLMGVCSGIGNSLSVDPLWIRIGLVASVLLGFGLPIFIYLAIGLIAD